MYIKDWEKMEEARELSVQWGSSEFRGIDVDAGLSGIGEQRRGGSRGDSGRWNA